MEVCLLEVIKQVRRVNEVYNEPFTKKKEDANVLKEESVRGIIIDPLLECLGWGKPKRLDIFQGNRIEYSVETGFVDYALIYEYKPRIFIEAKKGDQSIEEHEDQLKKYLKDETVDLGILTTGIEWDFYLPETNDQNELLKFKSLHLINSDINELTNTFSDLISIDTIFKNKTAQNISKHS